MSDINKKILKISEKLLKKEIEKTGLPAIDFHKVCLVYGKRLAKAYKVNEDFILACLNFMDVKVGEAFIKKRVQDHIQMSLEASLKAVKPLNLDKKLIKKISGCILNHHGTKKYPSIEAEICTNADCFKFLHPKAFIAFIASLGKRGRTFEEILKFAQEKIDEKIAVASLPEVKKEAQDYYCLLSKLLRKS